MASTVHGLYAAGPLTNTTIAGNIFSASAFGGDAMVLENATGLTVGGSTTGFGNTLTASKGNALWAAGNLQGSGVCYSSWVGNVRKTANMATGLIICPTP